MRPMHFYSCGGKVHDGNSLATAKSATMARQIKGEMDAMLSGVFDMQTNSSEATLWKYGEQSYWLHGEQFKIYYCYKVLSYVCDLHYMLRNANDSTVILKCCEKYKSCQHNYFQVLCTTCQEYSITNGP